MTAPLTLLTSWQRHVKRWGSCTGCALAQTRTKICLARGEVPAEVLFLGEGPGVSEDVMGLPFVGPAGKLLDHIIAEAQGLSRPFTYAISNVVCCYPIDPVTGQGMEPAKEHIKACTQRLRDLVWVVQPCLIVLVGGIAKKTVTGQAMFSNDKESQSLPWLSVPLRFEEIVHPAAILRNNPMMQGSMVQRAVVTLASAIDDLSVARSGVV